MYVKSQSGKCQNFAQTGKGTRRIFESPDISTLEFLRSYHFSDRIIESFFRPFFAGACLDPEIMSSSRVFRYLFNIFASGDAALPAKGMGEIPGQLAEGIPENKGISSIVLFSSVASQRGFAMHVSMGMDRWLDTFPGS